MVVIGFYLGVDIEEERDKFVLVLNLNTLWCRKSMITNIQTDQHNNPHTTTHWPRTLHTTVTIRTNYNAILLT